jgi:NAD(P)-dependent dehydrogenase (short-subunit alcohol dehydrogenase family)
MNRRTKTVATELLCEGRVCIVTGAGQGIGRAHSLELARQGALVVVNDLADRDDPSRSRAAGVVEEVRAAGGTAVDVAGDVTNWDDAHRVVDTAIAEFGRLDVVVANAGIIRYGPVQDIDQARFDAVIRTHVYGTFYIAHGAIAHWIARSEAEGSIDASLICTTSQSGFFCQPNTADYNTAKAGIAAFAVSAAGELEQFGIRVNAIAPRAYTNMAFEAGYPEPPTEQLQYERSPDNISPLIAFLASEEAKDITGRVLNVAFGTLAAMEGWRFGPTAESNERWKAAELGPIVRDLLSQVAPPQKWGISWEPPTAPVS